MKNGNVGHLEVGVKRKLARGGGDYEVLAVRLCARGGGRLGYVNKNPLVQSSNAEYISFTYMLARLNISTVNYSCNVATHSEHIK